MVAAGVFVSDPAGAEVPEPGAVLPAGSVLLSSGEVAGGSVVTGKVVSGLAGISASAPTNFISIPYSSGPNHAGAS